MALEIIDKSPAEKRQSRLRRLKYDKEILLCELKKVLARVQRIRKQLKNIDNEEYHLIYD